MSDAICTIEVLPTRPVSSVFFGGAACPIFDNFGTLWSDGTTYTGEVEPWLLDELNRFNLKIYRFPNMQPYYWNADMIEGDAKPSWMIEPIVLNRFNTEAFINYCRMFGAEPMITTTTLHTKTTDDANFIEADADMAEAWVRHCKDNNLGVKYWEIGNEDYWRNVTPSECASLYAQIVAAQAPRIRAADPDATILIQAVINPSEDLGFGGFTDAAVAAAGDNYDALAVHSYYGVARQYVYERWYWTESTTTSFNVDSAGVYDFEIGAATDEGKFANLRVTFSSTPDFEPGDILHTHAWVVTAGMGHDWFPVSSALHATQVTLPEGTIYLKVERENPGDGQGKLCVLAGSIKLASTEGPWTEVFFSNEDGHRWAFAYQPAVERWMTDCSSKYGKPIYVTESSAGCIGVDSGVKMFRVGPALVTALQTFLCLRSDVKTRIQWYTASNMNKGVAWSVIHGFLKRDPDAGVAEFGDRVALVDPRGQVQQFLSAYAGSNLIPVIIDSPKDSFEYWPGHPNTYSEYNQVDIVVTSSGDHYKIQAVNLTLENKTITVSGLPARLTGKVSVMRPDPDNLGVVGGRSQATLYDSIQFLEPLETSVTTNGDLTLTIPAASVLCSDLSVPSRLRGGPMARDLGVMIYIKDSNSNYPA
jgi:hypothetical protein